MKKIKILVYIAIIVIFIFAAQNFKEKVENYNNNSNKSYNFSVNLNNNNNNNNNININNREFAKATIKRVIDGDTIVVTINNVDYKVRLIGINSPEYTTEIEEYGKEATDYTTKMLYGKTVYLEKDVSETDKYGRLLRYVWLQVPNDFSENEIKENMFNASLVLNGYANATTYPPDVKYTNYFNKFEKTARNENIGLWQFK